MHIKKKRVQKSNFKFYFENKIVEYCDAYKYLGVTINEELDFEKTAEVLCESAGRALGGLITKMIKNGGFPLNVFKLLYESCVCSITDYGSEIFGFHQFDPVEKVHSRAIRAFLGVSKSAPISGLRAEINWLEPRSRSQVKMVRMYHRLVSMEDTRLTKRIFLWDLEFGKTQNFPTWNKEVEAILTRNDLRGTFNLNIFDIKSTINTLQSSLFKKDQAKLENLCQNRPKLRTYVQITDFNVDKPYLGKPLTFFQRRCLARVRLGVLPLRIETGRYERPRKPDVERTCAQCSTGAVEDEVHFLLKCPRHVLFRNQLFACINNDDFLNYQDLEKLKFLLNNPDIVKSTAKFIVNAFNNRTAD